MERKAFLEKKDNEVFIHIENLTTGERELMAIYDIPTASMKLIDVERYFHVLRHPESLHLILGYMEERGWILAKGDREARAAKEVVDEVKEETADEKCAVTWLVNRDTLRALLDAPTLLEGFTATHEALVPFVANLDLYVIATTSVKKKAGIENSGSLTLMSPSMKQSLEAITGLHKEELNNFITEKIRTVVGEPVTNESSIFDLKDTMTFTEFKRATSELRKRLKTV